VTPRRTRTALVAAAWVLVVAGALGGFFFLASKRSPVNVLLVTVDTLRADHVGCYGYGAAATPGMDALAARGTRFATAIAHVPLTTPSHASILTGLTPLRHGVRDNGGFALPAGTPTLARLLKDAGYRTAAFVSGFPLDRRFGLEIGFDTYDDRLPYGDDPRRAAYVERRADATTEAALRWLSSLDLAGAPFFAWVHYFDPHAPYEPPAEYGARFADRPYDGEVAFVDAQLRRLLEWIDRRRLTGRTLVLVTADHGESLGEHGEDTHGVFVYDATLRVPWIMAGPGVLPGRVASTVARGIDVTPTLLDLAGSRVPASVEGRSLRGAAAEALPDAPAYVESQFAHLQLGWAPLHGWRTARYKLIDAPRAELYALAADPGETTNRVASERETAARLHRALEAALQTPAPDAARGMDSDAAARLRALGYVAAGQTPAGGASSAGAGRPARDPKDGIALLRLVERGLAEARANPDLAIRELSAAIEEDPAMALARRYRAIAQAERKDFAAAISDLQALERDGRDTGDDLVLLGECLWRTHRAQESLAVLDRAVRRLPGSPEPLLGRARALRSLGRDDEAASAYEQILARVPDQPEAMRGLADVALARGDAARAAALYGKIRAADPGDVGALVKLGVLAMRDGQLEQAIASFREAVARDPRNPEALLDLGGALARSGRPAEAVPYLERALQAGPRTPVALNSLGFARVESGDLRGALEALRASLALDPRQPQVAAAATALAGGRMPRAGRP
jgi:arylsulfatase A-like enzyme/Flp pilus assembly protein TadD